MKQISMISSAIFASFMLLSQDSFASEGIVEEIKPFPKFGPIIRDVSDTTVTIVGQGKIPKGSGHDSIAMEGVAVLREITRDVQKAPDTLYSFPMTAIDRNVGFLKLANLKPGQEYKISMGYRELANHSEITPVVYKWKHSHTFNFSTRAVQPSETFSFLTGSCRRIGRTTPIMKRKGDRIFKGMNMNVDEYAHRGIKTDFIFFGGDQIYADALGENELLFPANEFSEYAGLYEKAFSQEGFRELTTKKGLPVYMQRDDHELWNDADAEKEALRSEQAKAGHKAYSLYQRPEGKDTPNFWYTTSNGAEMFFTDTRSERYPSLGRIMSDEQMQALKTWLSADVRRNKIKIITTSVPIFLLSTEDSWDGFKSQKHALVDFIVRENIKHVMFLSGDAHCQNDAEFFVSNTLGKDTGHRVVEVLVSGLYAIAHDKADQLSGKADATFKGEGYSLKTAEPLQETLTKNLFARISGNHTTKEVTVEVSDRKNKTLRVTKYQL